MDGNYDILYPFPEDGIDLVENPLTPIQKDWIVQKITASEETSNSLAKKLGCKPNYIVTIVSRHRRGIRQTGKRGRPKVLDEISHRKIETVKAAQEPLDIEASKIIINQEYLATMARNYPTKYEKLSSGRKRLRVSRRTRDRYLSTLFVDVFNEEVSDVDIDDEISELSK